MTNHQLDWLTWSRWKPQLHFVPLPKVSVRAFFTGHASINALFFAYWEFGGGAFPRPNWNSPLAYKRNLFSHSAPGRPTFGMVRSFTGCRVCWYVSKMPYNEVRENFSLLVLLHQLGSLKMNINYIHILLWGQARHVVHHKPHLYMMFNVPNTLMFFHCLTMEFKFLNSWVFLEVLFFASIVKEIALLLLVPTLAQCDVCQAWSFLTLLFPRLPKIKIQGKF